MLTLGYKKDETFTLVHPDGTQMHGRIESVSTGKVRIIWCVPKPVKICTDTVQAHRAYEQVEA